MTVKTRNRPGDGDAPRPDESFLQRFHRRKIEARHVAAQQAALPSEDPAALALPAEPAPEPTDADMPPLESLTADSDYSGFLSSKVSEGLRRAALRKLFHSEQFNVLDDLDDYAEDFTTFTALGDFVTSDMRHALEQAAKKQAEALEQALLDEPQPPSADAPPDDAALAATTADDGPDRDRDPTAVDQAASTVDPQAT